jgi:alanyl aminopeptidase
VHRTLLLSLAWLVVVVSGGARAAEPSPKPPELRLPAGVRPLRYQARLAVAPTSDTFEASIAIDLDLAAPTEIVWLNATGLTVSRASFKVGVQQVDAKVVPGGDDFLGFAPPAPLAKGAATLSVEYRGEISKTSSNGLFRQQEGADWYAFTEFEPIDARRVFPCFDEPGFKVPWQLSLKVPKALVALSNTHEVSSREVDDKTRLVTFAPTRPLPSYLIALAVGPFDFADAGKIGDRPVRIVTPKGRAADARWAQQTAVKVLEQLEAYFGTPYPFDKLDLISIPIANGAMENPGLVTFGESLIIARPEDESINFKRDFASIAMHELAHQWFGDLVTTAWWDDLWLNEAFATWMESTLLAKWQPAWRVDEESAEWTEGAMQDDALVSARCIRQPIVSKDDVKNAFDSITYSKGATVIGMFEQWVGPQRYRDGIRDYLAAHADGVATADLYLAAIAARAPELQVKQAFPTFLDKAGVPLISVELVCEPAPKLKLTQARYLPAGSTGTAAQTWRVPFCATFGAGEEKGRACTLLDAAQGELALTGIKQCPTWVNANPERSGYWRVLYRGELLPRLMGKDGPRLSAREKIGLLGDIGAMVHSGDLPYADALAHVAPLAGDESRAVVGAAIDLVAALRADELFPAALAPNYARFVRNTFGARAKALGLASRPSDDEDTRLLRPEVLRLVADQGEDTDLRKQAVVRARAWLADHNAVDPDMVQTVLDIAAIGGDKALYEAYLSAAKKTGADIRSRNRLLRALGRFRQKELASRSFDLVLTDTFDFREASRMIFGAASFPALRPLAYDFVKKHFDALVARAPRDFGAWLPGVGSGFCDEEHRADLESFFRERSKKFGGGPRFLDQTVEGVRLCGEYKKRQAASVADFLKKQK